MNGDSLSYAVITPVRNEAANLQRLADCLATQTALPLAWIIVDNGSSDETLQVGRSLELAHEWIHVQVAPASANVMRGGPVVRAFHKGLDNLDPAPAIVVKLDADISMNSSHFEQLLAQFQRDPMLGIAGGIGYELQPDGVWRQRHGTGPGVWGACRAYRWQCLEELLPLEERMGWDTLDLMKANVLGWKAKTFLDLGFRHHRVEGERDGARIKTWIIQGGVAHYMGYRFSYLILRTLYRAFKDPAAIGILWGYLRARIRREPPCVDAALRAHVRKQQAFRNLPSRAREALRPREALDGRPV